MGDKYNESSGKPGRPGAEFFRKNRHDPPIIDDLAQPRGVTSQVKNGRRYYYARIYDTAAPNGRYLTLGTFATLYDARAAVRRAESMRCELPYLGAVTRRAENKIARLENPQPGDDEPIDWDQED